MKYLKITMFVLTASLHGMSKSEKDPKPYFIENDTIEMHVPLGWNDKLESGEIVKLCSDFRHPKDIGLIVTELKTSEKAIDESFKVLAEENGYSYIFPNCRKEQLEGNILHVKTLDYYLRTDWYKLVQSYYYGHDQSLHVICIVGILNKKISSIPIKFVHYKGNKMCVCGSNSATVIYFEPSDSEIDVSQSQKLEESL